jgi:uncharacterized membrane protein YbhN (UPF0104 family)
MLILFLFAIAATVIAVGLWRMTQNSRNILKIPARISSVVLACVSVFDVFCDVLVFSCHVWDF